MCAAAISFARIRRLYYGAADPKGGAVESRRAVLRRRPPAITCPRSIRRSAKAKRQRCCGIFSSATVSDAVFDTTSVIIRKAGWSSVPKAAAIGRRRGVLDTRFAGMTTSCGRRPRLPRREKRLQRLRRRVGFSSVRKCPESTGAPDTLVAQVFQVSSGVAAALAMPASPHSASIGIVILLPAS